jgi:hypothetical protein
MAEGHGYPLLWSGDHNNGGKAGAVLAKAFPDSWWKSSRRNCRRRPLSISTAVAVSIALSSARCSGVHGDGYEEGLEDHLPAPEKVRRRHNMKTP